jgi:hypothetical protein
LDRLARPDRQDHGKARIQDIEFLAVNLLQSQALEEAGGCVDVPMDAHLAVLISEDLLK